MYKGSIYGLKESFRERSVTQNIYNLRNSEHDLTLPKPTTEYLRISFKYSGAMLWNDVFHVKLNWPVLSINAN